ncbi:importin-5 [Haematococcus lacustris]|uniref:Importin-5 n=1 Tax=Haematococcus lacustris TaxID=44745 RepID=A0A699YNC4_HAELA|nr:importin-5 [Haematococcus lacustris]
MAKSVVGRGRWGLNGYKPTFVRQAAGGCPQLFLWVGLVSTSPPAADLPEHTPRLHQACLLASLQNGASLPRVLGVLVTILGHGTRLVSGDVGKRLALQLHSLQPSVPQDALQTSLSALSDKQRANFNTFMAGNVPDGKDD